MLNNTSDNHAAITFYDQSLLTAKIGDTVYVAMRPIVKGMGLDWKAQFRKLTEQREKFSCGHMTTTAADGKQYEMISLPLEKLNGWLFSINPEKVKPEIRDKVIRYQEECFSVLYNYWHKGVAVNPRLRRRLNHSGLKISQRIRLMEIASRMLQYDEPTRERMYDSYCELCENLGACPSDDGNDVLVDFLDGFCSFSPSSVITKKDLYGAYREYAKENGLHVMNRENFFKTLYKRSGVRQSRPFMNGQRTHCIQGLELNGNGHKEVHHA